MSFGCSGTSKSCGWDLYEGRFLSSSYSAWLVVVYSSGDIFAMEEKDQNGISLPLSSSWEMHMKLSFFL